MDTPNNLNVSPALMSEIVDYIAGSGSVIQKQASEREAFNNKIEDTVKVLIERGVMPPTAREKIASTLRENPAAALDYLVKLSGHIKAPSLGKPAEKQAEERTPQFSAEPPRGEADNAFSRGLGLQA